MSDQPRIVRSGATLFSFVLLCALLAPSEARGEATAGGVEVQIAALSALEPAQRIAAAQALGESLDPRAVGPLVRVLTNDPVPEVRGWVVRTLGVYGTAEARGALAQAAQRDADERVRGLATQMLGNVASAPWQSPSAARGYGPGPGVQRQRRPGLGLIIAGWAVFGGSYLISLLAAAGTAAEGIEGTWPLFLPAVGPIVQAGFLFDEANETSEYDYESRPSSALGVLALLDGLIQLTGLTLAILGHVQRSRANRVEPEQPAAGISRFALLPSGPGDGPGLTFAGAF